MAATANKLPALADLLSLLPTLHSHWVVAANSRHFACRKCAVPWGVTNTATAGCMDSQSVKSIAVPGERGYDAGKKVNGVKRHILVDAMGLLMAVVLTAGSVQDRDGARILLQRLKWGLQKAATRVD
jgi:hypothetical protein